MTKAANGIGLLQYIPQSDFKKLCAKWSMDKGVRGLSSWKFISTLILSQIVQLRTLREIAAVFGVARSTMSDACRLRSHGFFQELADVILLKISTCDIKRKERQAIRDILAIDSTECQIHGSLFNFVHWKRGIKKASAKLHIVWNVSNHWISDYRITGGRRNDLTVAKKFCIEFGKTYVFDRAYVDLNFWLYIIKNGSHFVTRLKRAPRKEAIHKVVLNKEDFNKTGVLYDGKWTASDTAVCRLGLKSKSVVFRHVIYRDPKSGRIFDFITSDFECPPEEIAEIYKKRWSVELLFRWLKGHLNIRTLEMKNLNAIKVLLSTAVIIQLLTRLAMLMNEYSGTAWEYLRQLRIDAAVNGLQTEDLRLFALVDAIPAQETSL